MKRAFTMIELIFVIVIIGILAAVAMPKLAATRGEAEAAVCVHEVGQLIREISTRYAKDGNKNFKTLGIEDMTNIVTNATTDGLTKGIAEAGTTTVETGITYLCDGVSIVTIISADSGADYNLTVSATDSNTPASQIAKEKIIKNVLNGLSTKNFVL